MKLWVLDSRSKGVRFGAQGLGVMLTFFAASAARSGTSNSSSSEGVQGRRVAGFRVAGLGLQECRVEGLRGRRKVVVRIGV